MPFILMYDTLNLVQKQKFYGLKKSLYFIRFFAIDAKIANFAVMGHLYSIFLKNTCVKRLEKN